MLIYTPGAPVHPGQRWDQADKGSYQQLRLHQGLLHSLAGGRPLRVLRAGAISRENMTIKLTHAEEQRLIVAFAEGIGAIEVTAGSSLPAASTEWAAPVAADLTQDVQDRIAKWCGERGLVHFLYHELQSRLNSVEEYESDAPNRLLTTVQGFENTIGLAKVLVARLRSLPLRYRATVCLPSQFGIPLLRHLPTRLPLSPNVELCRAEGLPKPFPVTSDIELLDRLLFFSWEPEEYVREIGPGQLFLSAVLLGYAGPSDSTMIGRELEDSLRAFYGAAQALGITSRQLTSKKQQKPQIMIHEESAGRPLIQTEELEADLTNFTRFGSARFMNASGDDPASHIRTALDRVSVIFRNDTFSRRIFTAAIWYFRAGLSQRPLDRLLESTIAIEVMLGDKDTSETGGLTKLLANRCAYLLGRSQAQRDEILRLFISIYRLRSSIVHSGKHQLEPNDADTVEAAYELCGRIIERELTAGASMAEAETL